MNGNDAAGDASSPPPKTERPRSRTMDRKIRPSGFSAFSPGKQGRRIPSRDQDPPPPPLPSTTAATPSTPENNKGRGLLNVRDLVRRIEKSGKRSSSKPDAGASPGDEAAAATKDDEACQDQGAASATMPPSPAGGDGAAFARHRRFPLPPTTSTTTPTPPQQQQQGDGPRHGGFRRCYDDAMAAPPPVVPLASAITPSKKNSGAAAAAASVSPPPSPTRGQTEQRPSPECSVALHRGQFNNPRLGDSDNLAAHNVAAATETAALQQQRQQQQPQWASAGRLKGKNSALDVFGISLGGSSVAAADAAPVKATPASVRTGSSATSGGGDAVKPKEHLGTMAYHKGSSEDVGRYGSRHEFPVGEKYIDISAKGRGSSEETADSTKAKRGVSGPPSKPHPAKAKPKPASYSSSVASPTPAPDDDDGGDGGNGTPRWRSAAESRVFWEGVRAALFVSDDEMDEYSQQQDEARWLRAREAQDRLFWQQQQQQQRQQQQQMAATPLGNGGFAEDCALCRAAAAAAAAGDGVGLAAFPTPLQPVTPWDPAGVANRSAMVTPLWRGFRRHRSLASARSSTR